MRFKIAATILVLLSGLAAMPQSAPQVKPAPQSSSSALEAKLAATENLLSAERKNVAACFVLQNQLKSENARLRDQLGLEQAQSAAAQQRSQRQIGALEMAGIEKDAALAGEKKVNVAVTAERDAALLRVKAANRANLCLWFSFGCI